MEARFPLFYGWGLVALAVALAGAVVGLALQFDTVVLDLVQSVRHLILR